MSHVHASEPRTTKSAIVVPVDPAIAEVEHAASAALRSAGLLLPHLGGLVRIVEVVGTPLVPTAGVFLSGRIVVNPRWFLGLALPERIFVMAHEALHLALRTHERCVGTDARLFNVAHDYIINDMLCTELGCPVPADGLDMPGAAERSAEQIVEELKAAAGEGAAMPSQAWSGIQLAPAGPGTGVGTLGEALAKAGSEQTLREMQAGRIRHRRKNSKPRTLADLVADTMNRRAIEQAKGAPEPDMLDVLLDQIERQWFPPASTADAEARRAAVERAIDKALALGAWRDKITANGMKVPDETAPVAGSIFNAERLRAHPPWEPSMQRWLEDVAPGERTFSRPSRRQGERTDLVMPGRRREGWTLNLMLDTSGSMWSELGKLLGIIKGFCEAVGIGQVRILQCGERLETDELVEVGKLDAYRILGGYGGDLGSGFDRLTADPEVTSVIVVTDGMILFPATPMPYDVLWAQVGSYGGFKPPYGRVIKVLM